MDSIIQERQRKIRRYLHDFGKLFLDITKLSFGSLVLGSVIKWDISHATVFLIGLIVSTASAILGTVLVISFEEKK